MRRIFWVNLLHDWVTRQVTHEVRKSGTQDFFGGPLCWWLTTGKNVKIHSLRVPVIKFIRYKQLVYHSPIILKKLWFLWICKIWGSFVKNLYFVNNCLIKGVLHLWALFLKTLCIFSKNKPNLDKVSYGSGQKCSTELKNHSFTSVEAIVVKLQRKMCENQYFPRFEP